MNNFTTYVAGLMFNENFSQVALIKKNRPELQKGKFNAIGGKVNDNEGYKTALIREFEEETGYKTNSNDWITVCVLSQLNYKVYFYYSVSDLSKLKRTTDEEIKIIYVDDVWCLNLVPPLLTVIGMVMDRNEIELGLGNIIYVKYKYDES